MTTENEKVNFSISIVLPSSHKAIAVIGVLAFVDAFPVWILNFFCGRFFIIFLPRHPSFPALPNRTSHPFRALKYVDQNLYICTFRISRV